MAAAFVAALLSGLAAAARPADTQPTVTKPPDALHLDRFYEKYVDAAGIPVISSGKVPDAALLMAADLIDHMLANRPDVAAAMAKSGARVAVMAKSEVTTDVPEHRHLKPKAYWDQRARGLGGTRFIPTTSCAEENLLGYEDDRYRGENILIHEFAHAIHEIGMASLDAGFDARLKQTFDDAIAKGRWVKTYAASNRNEY